MAAAYSSVSSDEDETEQFTIITRSPGEVETCIINGYVTADLTAYDVIPDFPNFMDVNNLQVIRMSTNELQNIPDEDCKIPKRFCKMKYLKKLSLFGDAFRPGFGLLRLPQEFGQLVSLEELNLQHNHFTEFPEQICDLTKLKKLYLNGCEQSSISPRISNLLNLVEADFSNNDFSNGLPTQLFDLPKLKDLYLIECNLSHLPPEIGKLQQLEGIRLNNNLLEDLPSEIFTLKHLTKLSASNNKIKKLSPEVIGLQSLKYLFLKGNNLVCLPDEISKLPYLQVIDVFGNKLTCLPNVITELDSSTKVVVTGNEYLQKPPLNICTKGMDSIKGYFESMAKAKSIHSNRIKIVMLGESGAGKTCLTKALVYSKATESELDDSTIGVEIYPWRIEPDGLEACVVDCAGQRRYQLTHPFFLSEESLHIVVVNLKKYEIKEESFKENVEDWIKWITARLLCPRIMIVPTHRDKCDEIELMSKCEDILSRVKAHEQQEIKRIDFEIRDIKQKEPSHSNRGHNNELEQLQWLKKHRPIISSIMWSEKLNVNHTSMSVVPVCSKEELHGTIPLQDEIKRVAMVKDLFPSVGRDLPDTWVVLEKAIRQYRKDRRPDQVPCMKFEEFAEFANEKAKLTGLCLKSALVYLDSIGEIKFYRELPETEYNVFLDLPWLCKLVKLLFRHDYDWAIKFQADYFKYDMEEVKFDNQLQELKSGGKLYLGLLRCIWMELGLNECEFQNMIKALLCFGLACEIPCSPDCDKALFIPWFLHSNLEGESREEFFASHPADNEVECRLKFIIVGYLPAGLFDRLCVRTYAVGTDVNAWKDSMLIYLERDTQIFLEVMNDKPEINVIGRCKCLGQEQLWIAVLKIVRELETLLAEWPRLVYNTYTVCPHCVKKKLPKPYNFNCKWMKGKAPSSSRCPNSKFKKHTVDKSCLVPSKDILNRVQGSVQPLSELVTDTLLSDLSHRISDDWEKVATHLGLDYDQIAALKVDHPSNIAERVNAMCQKWKRSKGSQATRKQLINALKMSERLDLEEKVWNIA